MADVKPPPAAHDERTTALLFLQYLRESLVRKVEGVSDADARRSPVASGTTLLWLTKHCAYAETIWVLSRFAGIPDSTPANTLSDDDTVQSVIDQYRATWVAVDAVIAAAPDLEQRPVDYPVAEINLRWIVTHLIEEIARHAGHADILRELLDGQTGR
jgi:hypothetical protein